MSEHMGQAFCVSFEKIGYETAFDKRRWAGPVIATPDSLYCVLAVANSTADLIPGGLLGGLFGIAGAVIAAAIQPDPSTPRPVCAKLGSLPEVLREPGFGPLQRL